MSESTRHKGPYLVYVSDEPQVPTRVKRLTRRISGRENSTPFLFRKGGTGGPYPPSFAVEELLRETSLGETPEKVELGKYRSFAYGHS